MTLQNKTVMYGTLFIEDYKFILRTIAGHDILCGANNPDVWRDMAHAAESPREIGLRGIAEYDPETNRYLHFKVTEITPYREIPLTDEALDALRDAIANADDDGDIEALIAELRGHED